MKKRIFATKIETNNSKKKRNKGNRHFFAKRASVGDESALSFFLFALAC
jgi:hypothetical protein